MTTLCKTTRAVANFLILQNQNMQAKIAQQAMIIVTYTITYLVSSQSESKTILPFKSGSVRDLKATSFLAAFAISLD